MPQVRHLDGLIGRRDRYPIFGIKRSAAVGLYWLVSFFIAIIAGMLSLDVIWWIVLARLAPNSGARIVVHLFMAAQMIALIWLIGGRISGNGYDRLLPKFA